MLRESSRPTLRALCALALLTIAAAGCSNTPKPKTDAAPGDSATLRTLDSGTVQGYANPFGGHTWLGIPFAAPPVGALRWRPPQPVQTWEGVRNALLPGEPCLQFGSPLGGVGSVGSRQGNEDCLYLNVYAPALDAAQRAQLRLPVMVWIHGGGNGAGIGATTGHWGPGPESNQHGLAANGF